MTSDDLEIIKDTIREVVNGKIDKLTLIVKKQAQKLDKHIENTEAFRTVSYAYMERMKPLEEGMTTVQSLVKVAKFLGLLEHQLPAVNDEPDSLTLRHRLLHDERRHDRFSEPAWSVEDDPRALAFGETFRHRRARRFNHAHLRRTECVRAYSHFTYSYSQSP